MSRPETEKHSPRCDKLHLGETDRCPEAVRPAADSILRMIGRTLVGKYRLVRCIGHGGMGSIFEAEHTVIGSRVAVKLLHEPFALSFEPVQRLYREARAAAAVSHPNVIQVIDIAETEWGVPFLVMELLKGESLRSYLNRRGPIPLVECLDVGIQMLRGLAAAHEVGVVHRDIKSDNVFLARDERQGGFCVKLLDFGISTFGRAPRQVPQEKHTGVVLGTPHYMAPEQAQGRGDLDERVDVYAAGVVLYEMVTGDVPHAALNPSALLSKKVEGKIAPPSSNRSDVPDGLDALIMGALSPDREARPQGCGELAGALGIIREQMR